jgi:hypothetical protein
MAQKWCFLRAPGTESLRKAWLPCLRGAQEDALFFRSGVAGGKGPQRRGRKTVASSRLQAPGRSPPGRGPWSYFYGVCCGIETRTVMSVLARGDWLTLKNLLRPSCESVDLGIMLSSKSLRRMIICLVLLLPAITRISAAGQSSSTLCAPTAHAVVLYAPESNLERREIETLRSAKVTSIVQRSEQP